MLGEIFNAYLMVLYSVFALIAVIAIYIAVFYATCRFFIWLIKFTFEREFIYLKSFVERLFSKSSQ
jgi:hypothetical protein